MSLPAVQFSGISSGLNTRAIIDAIMAQESLPLTRLAQREALWTAKSTALGQVRDKLVDAVNKLKAFSLRGAAGAHAATSSNATALSASANSDAVAGSYAITISRLASPTRATSTAAIGTAIGPADAANAMSTLNLPGSVTAGDIGVVVNGKVVKVAVGNPASTSLQSVLDDIADAIETEIVATDPAATVSATIVNNRVEIATSGGNLSHDLRFSVAGDSSNFLSIVGLAGRSIAFADGSPLTGNRLLGVVRTTGALDAAGLSGLASTAAGRLTINGVHIDYDTTTDSLSDLITRINSSSAGVSVVLDRANDKLVMSQRDAGPKAIQITDTAGTLGAALRLAPGTTDAQDVGDSALFTVDGVNHEALSNTVTDVIPGVTLSLLAESATPITLSVARDVANAKKAMRDVVSSVNAALDSLESLTGLGGNNKAVLRDESTVRALYYELRSLMTGTHGSSETMRSLSDVGVTTSSAGTSMSRRFQFDEAKFDQALANDPGGVAALLDGPSGLIATIATRVDAHASASGLLVTRQNELRAQIDRLPAERERIESRLERRRASLERQYAALERMLSANQSALSALSQQAAAKSKE